MDLGRRLRAADRRPRAARRDGRPRRRARPTVQIWRSGRWRNRGRPVARSRTRSRLRAHAARRRARRPPHLHGDVGIAADRERPRLRPALLGASGVKIVVGHLYPDYLNIYADRGNIAVLSRRAAWRGHELDVRPVSIGEPVHPGEHDLLYIGGGQDREQALVAQDLLAKAAGVRESVAEGAAVLAV